MHDAVVIGGGFYGAAIAVYLKQRRGFPRVALLEQDRELLRRASYHNQARVHNGYHYPRSFTTAFRSRINLPRFVRDHASAVRRDFTKLYAIAKRGSKVTAAQFVRFCREIGAVLEPAPPALRALFEPRLVEDVFVVEEYAFDADRLAEEAIAELAGAGVETLLGTRVQRVVAAPGGGIGVELDGAASRGALLEARYVFNCTYSGLGQVFGGGPGLRAGLKHEIAELALVRVPEALRGVGVTVMDGPFFSLMPFPPRGLHALSHVRYTPHRHWVDEPGLDPYAKLAAYDRATRVDRMLRDAARYLPALAGCEAAEALFEVKTVLVKNESDDGRPILVERHAALSTCYSILGGKIDNIYDVLERLDAEPLPLA